MRSKVRRPALRWALIVLACLAGVVCLWRTVGAGIRHRRVERAIGQFEQNPSRASALALAELLQSYTATAEQGSRILILLRQPTVITRSTYAAGRPVWVGLERPFLLIFRHIFSCHDEYGIVEAGGVCAAPQGHASKIRHLNGLSAEQAKPGVHQLTVRGAYRVAFSRGGGLSEAGHWVGDLLRKMGLSPGGDRSPDRAYECAFEVPFEVTVVPKEQAETIESISSDQLGNAMIDAFQLGVPRDRGRRLVAPGKIRHHAVASLQYRDLPVPAVFRVRLHLSDGSGPATVLEDPEPLIAMAGTSGKRSLSCWFDKPGTYTGTLILHRDLTRAYQDPTIKAIWGEPLEFPISFTIAEEPSDPQEQTAANEAPMPVY